MSMLYFIRDAILAMLKGGLLYWSWLLILLSLTGVGTSYYIDQLQHGLVVTGMSDQVSWGFYIANFAFLVGVAASSVLLVIPAYIFHQSSAKKIALLGEGLAVSAVIMSMLFVIVDLGRPEHIWHMFPILGKFNFPMSILAWDVVVLFGYLVLNLIIPFYLQYCHYCDKEPKQWLYFPLVILAIFWAISIHTVTAFLFSANTARHFWHTALVGPRFIASAFVSGPAVIILVMQIIRAFAKYPINQEVIRTTALIMAVALQISLFFVGVELFTDFYNETSHAASIRYLYFGLHGFNSLQTWIWSALILNLLAFLILTIHPLRENIVMLNLACIFTIIGVWIEKGMGFVVPGFIPTPLGEIYEYAPTITEYWVSIGIWAIGILAFTLMAKASIKIELGEIRYSNINRFISS